MWGLSEFLKRMRSEKEGCHLSVCVCSFRLHRGAFKNDNDGVEIRVNYRIRWVLTLTTKALHANTHEYTE